MSERDDRFGHDASDDDAVEQQLRGLLAKVDPVPERVVEAGRGAFAWRTIDAELAELTALAELTHDSLVDDELAPAGVRGQAGPRTLTFESPVLTLEVEVSGTGGEMRRLVGQLVPPSAAEILVEHRAGGAPGAAGVADELGRFVIEAVRAGDARLRFTLADGSAVRTKWTRL
jgi:hypothetical protein